MLGKKLFGTVCILAVLLLSGCGNSFRIDYSNIRADVRYSGSRSVAIAVLDQRPYVLTGENDPRYVGTIRGGYGNPFDLWTRSGRKLADEMAATVAESLGAKGFRVVAVKTAVGADSAPLLREIGPARAERVIFLDVKDWWSNYYPESWGTEKTELTVNVEMKVMDRDREVLGSARLAGTETPPSGWPADTIPRLYRKKMSELLNHRNVQDALR